MTYNRILSGNKKFHKNRSRKENHSSNVNRSSTNLSRHVCTKHFPFHLYKLDMQLILLKTFHQLSVIFNGDIYYDFANLQISNNYLNKHCGILHIILILFCFTYALYGKIEYTYKLMTPPLLTFDFVTMCTLTILNLIIICSSRSFFAKKMQIIMKSLENIDKNLRDFTDNTCKTTTTYLIFFVIMACLITIIYDCVVWIIVVKDNFHYHLFRNLQYLLVFIKLLFLHQFMEEISHKIQHLKDYIIHIINDYALKPYENKQENDNGEYTITGWTKSALEKAYKEENSNLKLVTRNFNEIITAWKNLLGANSFIMTFYHVLFVVEFLQMTCYIIAYFFGNITDTVIESSLFIVLRVLWSFCLMVNKNKINKKISN